MMDRKETAERIQAIQARTDISSYDKFGMILGCIVEDVHREIDEIEERVEKIERRLPLERHE